MSKKTGIMILVLSIASIIMSVAALVMATSSMKSETAVKNAADVQYVLYLGTNDKDTNEPVFEPAEAKLQAEEILIKHFGGFTIQEANGGWIDGDKLYREFTMVIYLSDTNIDAVHKACDDMISKFNQSSVLIQANETVTEFYAGKS